MVSTKYFAITAIIVFSAVSSFAQTPRAQAAVLEKVKLISAYDFENEGGAMTGRGPYRWSSEPGAFRVMVTDLPDGAELTRMELESCTERNPSMAFWLEEICEGAADCRAEGMPVLAPPNEGGCVRSSVNLNAQPIVIDNKSKTVWIAGGMSEFDGSARFKVIRLYYRMLVPAAPLDPTFADVPATHPFYAFIEAMAASGLTGGCSNTEFCPDAAVTRGQLAVFLTTGLGLYNPSE